MKLLIMIINNITDENIWNRIFWMYISFFLLLVLITILSYKLFPEGILRGKHPFTGFELSPNLWASTLQIFAYNLIFTTLTISACLFARQSRVCPERFIALGYLAFWGITVTFAIYLGTWSQEIVTIAPPLHHRFLHLFDLIHRGGLWEFSGYLLAATSSFKFTLWYTDGKRIVAQRNFREITLSVIEKILFLFAFLFLLCGAFIESYGIIRLKE